MLGATPTLVMMWTSAIYCDACKMHKVMMHACLEQSANILVHQHYMQGLQARHGSVHTYHSMHSMHSVRSMHSVYSMHNMHVWSSLLSRGDLKPNLCGRFAATKSWSRFSTRLWRGGRSPCCLCHQERQKRKHGRPAGKQTKPACCTSWTFCAGNTCLKQCSSSPHPR